MKRINEKEFIKQEKILQRNLKEDGKQIQEDVKGQAPD